MAANYFFLALSLNKVFIIIIIIIILRKLTPDTEWNCVWSAVLF